MLRDEAKELIVRFISTYSYDGAVFFEMQKMNNHQDIISIVHFKTIRLK